MVFRSNLARRLFSPMKIVFASPHLAHHFFLYYPYTLLSLLPPCECIFIGNKGYRKFVFRRFLTKLKKKKESRQESSHPNFPLVYLIFFLLRSIQLSGGFIGSAIFLCLLCDHLNLSVIVQLHLNMPRTPAIYTHRRNSGQPRTCWRASKLEMDIVSNSQKHALLSNEGDQIN